MTELDRWQERYSSTEYLFGKRPNYFLTSCREMLPAKGRVLAVADGESRNGVWLAERGLDVVAVEFAPAALNKAAALAREHGVAIERTFTTGNTRPMRSTSSSISLPSSVRPPSANRNGPVCKRR